MTVTQVRRPGASAFARGLTRAVGFAFYLLAVQALLTAAVGISVFLSGRIASDLILPAASIVLAGAYVAVGYHLRRYHLWARNFAFAFASISLIAFPVGTGLGLVIVACLVNANRAGIFPSLRRAVPEEPLLRFEPELVAEQAV